MATIILRPNGAGVLTEHSRSEGSTNWENVDEAVSDGDTTIIVNNAIAVKKDLYTIESSGISGDSVINSVTVYAVSKIVNFVKGNHYIGLGIRENSTNTFSSNQSLTTSYATYSNTWSTRPSGGSWAKSDIDSIQIGVNTENVEDNSFNLHVTQVYVEIDYTPPPPSTFTGFGTVTGLLTITL